MSETRQVRRAKERHEAKRLKPNYPIKAQKGGPSIVMVHKNRKHRNDGLDYFRDR